MSGRIFISYRRDDSQAAAGRLHDRLLSHFARNQLFMDVDAIEPGVDFVKTVDEQVSNCSAFIAVLGPDWLTARNPQGRRRLDDPMDYVRIEIELALQRDIRVIPVLVDGASMPAAEDLPSSIALFARRHAVEIAHHRFVGDCDDLARIIKRATGMETEPVSPQQTAALPPAQDERPLSWIEILFSFRGRVSRLQFLLSFVCVMTCAIAFGVFVLFAIEASAVAVQSQETSRKLVALLERRVSLLVVIIFVWPLWALIMKRLHDLDHGWKAFAPFVALDMTSVVLDFIGYVQLSQQITLVTAGIGVMLAAIKGTVGPNRYGPDPLAGRGAKYVRPPAR